MAKIRKNAHSTYFFVNFFYLLEIIGNNVIVFNALQDHKSIE